MFVIWSSFCHGFVSNYSIHAFECFCTNLQSVYFAYKTVTTNCKTSMIMNILMTVARFTSKIFETFYFIRIYVDLNCKIKNLFYVLFADWHMSVKRKKYWVNVSATIAQTSTAMQVTLFSSILLSVSISSSLSLHCWKKDTIIRTIFILKHISVEKQDNYKIRLLETATSYRRNDKMYGISSIVIYEARRMWWRFPNLLLDIYAVMGTVNTHQLLSMRYLLMAWCLLYKIL